MNLDLIPTAEALKTVTLDAERAKRQEAGIKSISFQLQKANEYGRHEITLFQDYMISTYSLDVVMLKKIFEEKGYKVTDTKDSFGYTDSIIVQW